MAQIGDLTSVAGLATTNVVSGKVGERVGGRGALIKVFAVNTTATSFGELKATMMVGSEVLCQDQVLTLDADGLKTPDHQICSGQALPGDQLSLRVENTHATTARVVHWLIDVQYL